MDSSENPEPEKKTIAGKIYWCIDRLFWLLGGVTACVGVWFYIFPQEGADSLQKVLEALEQRAYETRRPSIEFVEFWQSMEDETEIQYTMLRYYNPSPNGAVENAKVKLYYKTDAGNYEILYQEPQPYLAAESSRDIFDIETGVKIGNPAALCVEYADGATALTPLSPEHENDIVKYSQSGDTQKSGGGCEAAVRKL